MSDGPARVARQILAHHSKSFAFAGRFLPAGCREDATALYAWCRRCDDAVDRPSGIVARAVAVDRLRSELDRIYGPATEGVGEGDGDGSETELVLAGFQRVVRRRAIPRCYADDLVAMCWSRSQAGQALERLTGLLADLGLEPKAAKTRIVHLEEGGEGFDFLGFHHRLVRSRGLNGKRPVTFLARWPADKAMQHARDRIRELTRRSRLLLAPEWIVADLNRFLGGWAAHFRHGNSAARFDKISEYVRMRLERFISKRHRRSLAFGRWVVAFSSPNRLGLITLPGIVVAPRPFRDRRGKPNAAGERRR